MKRSPSQIAATRAERKRWEALSAEELKRNAELIKCQPLCKLCHRKKTIEERTPPHGTNGRYTGKCECRCLLCRKAHAIANAKYR
jgi:hypothetical protein